MSQVLRLQIEDAQLRPGATCRVQEPDGSTGGEYRVLDVRGSPALKRYGLSPWTALAPVTDRAGVPILVAGLGGANELVPARPVQAAFELLRQYTRHVAPGVEAETAAWAAHRLAQPRASTQRDAHELFQQVCFVLGVCVLTNVVPPPPTGKFVLAISSDGKTQTRRRVDWAQSSEVSPGGVVRGTSVVGPGADGRRSVEMLKRGQLIGLGSAAELLEAFRFACAAFRQGIWRPPDVPKREIAAHLARLNTMDMLTQRYYADPPTQLRNGHCIATVALHIARLLDVSIAVTDELFGTESWTPGGEVCSDRARQTLGPEDMASLSAAVREACGGKLRTCLDTGNELHVFFESHAVSRRELQMELLHLLAASAGSLSEKRDLYALSAFRQASIAGGLGNIHSDAYTSELLTAWVPSEYAVSVAAGGDRAMCWDATALSRWICRAEDLLHKSLLLIDLPYLDARR